MGVSETVYSQQGGTLADFNVTLNPDLLTNLLSNGDEGIKEMVESILNQVLDAQMIEHPGANRHERSILSQGLIAMDIGNVL